MSSYARPPLPCTDTIITTEGSASVGNGKTDLHDLYKYVHRYVSSNIKLKCEPRLFVYTVTTNILSCQY